MVAPLLARLTLQDFTREQNELSFIRMAAPSPSLGAPVNWKRIFVYLTHFSDGPATGIRNGHFNATRLTAWFMRTGSSSATSRGVHASAQPGQWLVCLPGVRDQKIDKNARYVSLHFAIECPDNPAEWTGPAVMVFDQTPSLDRTLRQLQQSKVSRYMSEAGIFHPQEIAATFVETFHFQKCSSAFFQELLQVLASRQAFCHAPTIQDPRVRHSRQFLAQCDFRQHFSRRQLAAQYDLSASQMDRLWRQELNITPQDYWDQCRLKQACALLEVKEHLIKEVSYMVGFQYVSRFCIWFRNKMQESPSSYRRRHMSQ